MGMRSIDPDGNVGHIGIDGFQEKEPVAQSELEFRFLKKTEDYLLDYLPKDDEGLVRKTTQQSRVTRQLVTPKRQALQAERNLDYAKGAKKIPSELDEKLVEVAGEFKEEDKRLLKITEKGHGGTHFSNTKGIVDEVLDDCGFKPEDFLSNVIPHDTEMRAIGSKVEGFEETVTLKNGKTSTSVYKEGDGHFYDGVTEVSHKLKGKKEGVEIKAMWCRQMHIVMNVAVKDADGKITTRKICVLEKPEDQFGGDHFSLMPTQYYPSNWVFSTEYMHVMCTGANFHNLANAAYLFTYGPEAIADFQDDVDNISEKTKAGKKRLKTTSPALGFLKKAVWRSRFELVAAALMNFKMKLNTANLQSMFSLAYNESYSENPIGQDLKLKEMSFDHRRELPKSFPIVGKLRAFQKRLTTATDDEVREFISYLGSVDVTKIPCKADGQSSNTGNAQGLIFTLKNAVFNEMWSRDEEEDERFSHLTAKERYLVERVEGRTQHVRETMGKPIEDIVVPLKPKTATK